MLNPGGSRIVERSADGAGCGRNPTQPASASAAPHVRRARRNQARGTSGNTGGTPRSLTCCSFETLPERAILCHFATPRAGRARAVLVQCRPVTPVVDPVALVVDDRARARAAGDPLTDLCVLATAAHADDGEAPGVRPIVLRDVGPQGIGLLISRTSPKWEPLSSGRYELLLLWLTIRRQYRVRGGIAPMPEAMVETYWNQKVHESRLLDLYYATYGAQPTTVPSPARSHAGGRAAAGAPAGGVPHPRADRGVARISGPAPRPPTLPPGGGGVARGNAGAVAVGACLSPTSPMLYWRSVWTPRRRGADARPPGT